MKYVVFDGFCGEQIIIFPKIIQHSVMADDIERSSFGSMRPISGGFVINGKCTGESVSLGMKSRLDADTALIPALLSLDKIDLSSAAKINENQSDAGVSKNKAKRLRKKVRS